MDDTYRINVQASYTRKNIMEKLIQTTREIIETASDLPSMFQRLSGLALDWNGMFSPRVLGVGRDLSLNDNKDIVCLGAGRVVAYFYKPGTHLPGLTGSLIDAGIKTSEAEKKQGTCKIGIGIYTPSSHLDGKNTMSDMVFIVTDDINEVRGLLEFF